MKSWSTHRLSIATNSWIVLSILLAITAIVMSLIGNRNLVVVGTNFFVLASMIVALQVFIGNSGIVSFGNLAFFAVGAYSTALLTIPPEIKSVALPLLPAVLQNLQVSFLPSVIGGALTAAIVAVVTGIIFTRMPENAMAMATLALLVIVHTTINNWEPVTRGSIGIYGIPRNTTMMNALLCLV